MSDVSDASRHADSPIMERSPTKVHPQTRRHVLTPDAEGLVLVMVGLPARGKSFISQKLQRFLRWRGHPARIFNVGDRRRTTCTAPQDAQFFSEANVEVRNKIAEGVLHEMIDWLRTGEGYGDIGRAAIFDATNSNKFRRANVVDMLRAELPQVKVLFIESVCDDMQTIEINLLQKVRASPDFEGQDEERALLELRARIREYESQYETLSPTEGFAFIKLFNLSSRLHLNHVYGRAAKSLVPYMMGIHVRRHRLARAAVPLRLAWPSRREAPRHLRPLRARAAGG